MRIVMFYHSLWSDWSHGNAHFLRGIATELKARGHDVAVFEPASSWSLHNLLTQYGEAPLRRFREVYPQLRSTRYDPARLDLDQALDGADLVVVHERNDHELIRRIGTHREGGGRYRLLFHDTHHRMVTDPPAMAGYELDHYDGVLACGAVLRDIYELSGKVRQAWTWHEAADTRVFRPVLLEKQQGDLVWIGNWGDDERTGELREYLIEPIRALSLRARVHGVRYPVETVELLDKAGIDYAGWLPNFEVPRVFARYRFTVHVPRRPYVQAVPGIPSIRIFEALACGIPLVCSPWDDIEELFTPGEDYLVARNGDEMTAHLRTLLHDPNLGCALAENGLEAIRARHTCAHRVNELLAIHQELSLSAPTPHMETSLA